MVNLLIKTFTFTELNYSILDPNIIIGWEEDLLSPITPKVDKMKIILRNGESLKTLPHANEFAPAPSWRKWNKLPFSRRFLKFVGCYFLLQICLEWDINSNKIAMSLVYRGHS